MKAVAAVKPWLTLAAVLGGLLAVAGYALQQHGLEAVATPRDRWLWLLGSAYLVLAVALGLLTRYWLRQRRKISDLFAANAALRAQLEQRRQAEAERNRLISILEATTDLVSTADPHGNISYINRAGRNMIGVGDQAEITLQIADIHPLWASKLIFNEGIPAATRTGAWSGQTAVRGADGREIPVSQVILCHHDDNGNLSFLSTIMRDISERQRSEQVMLRHNRLLRTLAGINAMQMADKDARQLMTEICRMLVEESQFRMAWIGLVEADGMEVQPVAFAGVEDGYLRAMEVRCDESPQGHGPTGRAIRSGQTVINPITATNATFSPWRESALARDFHSSAATPIKQHGRVVGTISVYSGEPDAFGEEEVVLLERLASELAHALESRGSAQTNRKLVAIVNHSHDFIGIADLDGNLQFINQAGLRLVGLYQDTAVQGMRITEVMHETMQGLLTEQVMPSLLSSGYWSGEMRLRNILTGAAVPTLGDAFLIHDEYGQPVNMALVSRDISERIRSEEALQQSEAALHLALEAGGLGDWKWDIATGEVVWSARCKALYGLSADDEVTYDRFLQAVHPDDRARVDALLKQALASGEGYEVEKRVVWPDGSVHWNLSWGRVLCDTSHQPRLMTGVTLDITDRKRAEQALRLSEERLRQAVRASQIGIFDHDHHTDSIYWSPELRQTFAWGADETVPLSVFFDDVFPADRESVAAAIRHSHDPTGDGAYDAEYRILRRDGQMRWLVALGQTFFEAHGAERYPLRSVGAVIDITERKQAEEALRLSEERLRQAVRVSQIGIFDHDHLADTIYWSPEKRNIHGWGADEDIDLPAFLNSVCPEDRPSIEAAVRRAHDPSGDGKYDVEYRILRRDGEVRWLTALGQTFFAGKHEERHPTRTVGAVIDITERKRAEQALREYQERLEELVAVRTQKIQEQAKIIDQIHDSVIATDLEGTIQSWNGGAERLFGYSAAEAVGRNIGFVYPEEEQGFLRDQVIAPLKSAGAQEVEVRMLRKNGEDFLAHLSLSLLRDEQGTPRGMVGYSIDITQRKHAESLLRQQTQELAALNQELEAFSYSVSHDLRAPLRGIDGFSQALLEDYADQLDQTGRDYLYRVRAGTQRMSDLIDDLLKLSRVTRSRMSPGWVDLSAMAREIVEQFQRCQADRRVTVNIVPGLEAWGDPGLLRVALENLLGNAWKYTAKQPEARIDFARHIENGEEVYFVRDNGAGFDMKYADKLFGAFQRLHHLTEFPGTGIGLATVQRIIHRHGGRIWAVAEERKGATFSFVLGSAPYAPNKKN